MHRVLTVDRATRCVVTRGDANFFADPPVAVREIFGYLDGLYDNTTGAARPLPLFRRLWNGAMRLLVGARRFGLPIDVALSSATALLRTVCRMLRREPPGVIQ
jgi:hypothetical protein